MGMDINAHLDRLNEISSAMEAALAAMGIKLKSELLARARQWIQDALMIRDDADIDVRALAELFSFSHYQEEQS